MRMFSLLFNREAIYKELGLDSIESISYYDDVWKRLKKNKFATISIGVIFFLVMVAIFAPLISPFDPLLQDLTQKLKGPSLQHLMGTDELGRDILSRIIYGTRISLSVGIISEIFVLVIGVTLGAMAGYYGGKIDIIISRLIEIFASFPFILFAIAVMFVLGTGIINVFIAIGVIGWTGMARFVRGNIIQLKEKEYISAAKANGASGPAIIFKHLLPNCLSVIIVLVTLDIPSAIMLEATLSFLGLGVQPPMASWGSMIDHAKLFMMHVPTYALFPGIAIMVTVLAFNTLGDGLRDALDPNLKNM